MNCFRRLGCLAFVGVLAALLPSSPQAGPPPYGLPGFTTGKRYLITHTATGASNLTDFQVKVQIDTATEITAGRMNADCSDIRVYADDGCNPTNPVNFWVADGTCNTAKTDIWLGLPSVRAGSNTPLAIFWGNPSATSVSNGTAVFPLFFDDFNGSTFDTDKWNTYGGMTQSGGLVTTHGGAVALWTKDVVLAAGQTVFGVRTNAQAASGADIEYGAATLVGPSGGNIHWASRYWTGVTWMAYDYSFASIGRGPSLGGICTNQDRVGSKWTNNPGDLTYFQTEFFYELNPGGGSTFGIYDKTGAKREVTLGSSSCQPAATERAYWQFDHSSATPNPISSLDYAYVRKYAKPDPIVVATGIDISDGTCVQNGSGPCTPETETSTCQSVKCSEHASVCIPNEPGSCFVDDDCDAADFCARGTFTCTTKLTAGETLPSDDLHDSCPPSGLNDACFSGRCDSTSSICIGNNGEDCTGASVCASNVCSDDHLCGAPDGSGDCDDLDDDVCRSGACSPHGHVCIPASSGSCWVDADCATADYCHRTTFTCTARLVTGSALPVDGLHTTCPVSAVNTACESGQCNPATGTCAVPNTEACENAAACVSNICSGDTCGYGSNEGPCTTGDQATVCRSGLCSVTSVCIPAGGCTVDEDCDGTHFCDGDSQLCVLRRTNGAGIPADHGVCDTSSGALGDPERACASGACNPSTNTCAGANLSTSCTAATECVSNVCGGNGQCGFASGEGTCTSDNAAARCQSGTCSQSSSTCVPSGSGACWEDTDCGSTAFCSRSTFACTARLAPGTPLPSDDLHESCPAAGTTTACASGRCNPVRNTCAVENGGACSSAASCVTDICGENDRCGHASGDGPCTPSTAAKVCQSGLCSATGGLCRPVGEGRCATDGDCAASEVCVASTLSCGPRGALGSATNPFPEDTVKTEGGGGCGAIPDGKPAGLTSVLVALLAVLALSRRRAKAVATSTAAVLLVGGVLLAGASAQAADFQNFSLNRYNPSRGGSEWFASESLQFEGDVKPRIDLIGDMAFRPLVLTRSSGERIRPIVAEQFIAHVIPSVTLAEVLRLSLTLPVAFFQGGTALSTTAIHYPSPHAGGVGDLRASMDLRVLDRGSLRLALGMDLILPSGSGNFYLSDEDARVVPRVMVAGDRERFTYAASLAYSDRQGVIPVEIGGGRLGPELYATAAFGYRITPRILVGPELYGSTVIRSDAFFDGHSSSLEVLLGGHATVTHQWRVGAGIARGLTSTVGSPAARVLFSVEFVPFASQ